MNTVVALLAAVGVFFLFDGLTGERRPPIRLMSRLDRLLAEGGMGSMNSGRLLGLCSLNLIAGVLVVAGITGSMVVACVIGALLGWVPMARVRSRRRKRQEHLRDAWPDAITTLVASVRAGISLGEACSSLADKGPEHLRAGFEAFRRSYRSRGSFQVALGDLRQTLSDPVADRVTAALEIAHEVGGTDLVRTLRALGDFVREDLRIRREIQARWSWTVTAARVAAAAPWLVLIMMASRPEAAQAYNSPAGLFVVLGGAVATLVGYRLMLRAARLPELRRLAR